MKSRRVHLFLALLLTLVFVGCDDDKDKNNGISKEQYDKRIKEYNDLVEKYNKIAEQNLESDKQIIKTGNSIVELNLLANDVRSLTNQIRNKIDEIDNVNNYSVYLNNDAKSKIRELNSKIGSATTKIDQLRNEIDQHLVKLDSNIDTLIKEQYQESQRLQVQRLKDSITALEGLKDLFRAQHNDLISYMHTRAAVFNAQGADAEALERALPARRLNPVVSGLTDGGRITGVARDSTTGRSISGAFVGFKLIPESNDYFYQTTTNNDGFYQSPFLREGTYFIDIISDGNIAIRNQEANVTIGEITQENVATTAPLAEGVYRIVMSWTSEKANAVRDVDSYLLVPASGNKVQDTVFYSNRSPHGAGADLDRDDTDWIGPETTTIRELRSETYKFWVNNFSDRDNLTALGNSEIQVIVYKGNQLLRTYRVPQGSGLNYELFHIINGNLIDINQYNDRL